MTGRLGGDLTGDVDGSMLGDLSLTTVFGVGAGTVSGDVTNINTFDDTGQPDQRLAGSLDINGTYTGTGMTATADGTLTGVDSGFEGDSVVLLTLNGVYRDNSGNLVVTGDATGGGSGDFDVTLINGGFYAE